MILKQRFSDGRTNYIDVGSDWMLIQQNADEFESLAKEQKIEKDCIAFVCFSKRVEPIYKDFPQWIYSNNGELFMCLS